MHDSGAGNDRVNSERAGETPKVGAKIGGGVVLLLVTMLIRGGIRMANESARESNRPPQIEKMPPMAAQFLEDYSRQMHADFEMRFQQIKQFQIDHQISDEDFDRVLKEVWRETFSFREPVWEQLGMDDWQRQCDWDVELVKHRLGALVPGNGSASSIDRDPTEVAPTSDEAAQKIDSTLIKDPANP
jgi:hypothetical protein